MESIIKEVVLKDGSIGNLEFKLYGKRVKYINIGLFDNDGFALAEISSLIRVEVDKRYIFIKELQVGRNCSNKGYGSIVLNALREVKEIFKIEDKLEYICGDLTKFDVDNDKEKLVRFYEKNSYTVTFYDEPIHEFIVGEVKLNL